jgi:hypothetical protein
LCPAELLRAKANYSAARAEDQRAIDNLTAIRLWDKACAPLPKLQPNISTCLTRVYPQIEDFLLSGDFEISGSIVEIRAGNKVAAFFAPTVAAVAPKAKEALVAELDPVARQRKAQQQAKQNQESAASSRQATVSAQIAALDVSSAQDAYDSALIAYTNRTDDNSKFQLDQAVIQTQIALLQKKSAANEAARAAGQTPPYGDIY